MGDLNKTGNQNVLNHVLNDQNTWINKLKKESASE